MTDQEIEQLAKDIYPHGVGIIRFIMNYGFVEASRKDFIQGAKLIRDKYEQKLKDNDN